MRPGQQQHQQQNKRMRGRGGRKGPNPMSRSFESNGPDVKIRGTAQHIADKYTTLARDASAAGDRIMAENYLQHAEHYGRIVAAAQGQFQPTQSERDYADDYEEDGDEAAGLDNGFAPSGAPDRQQPQGGYGGGERQPFREGRDNGQGQGERPRRDNDRREGRGDRPFQNREQFNRDGQNRDGQGRDGQGREDRRPVSHQPGTGPQPYAQGEGEGEFAQPRQDGGRQDGGRRENRRDRNRFNERSGERRFEERFGRPRDTQDGRGELNASNEVAPAPHAAEAQSERPAETVPAASSAPVVEPERVQDPAPVASPVSQVEEPRTRAPRRRRESAGVDGAAVPVAVAEEAVAPPVEPAEKAPTAARRRTAKAAPAAEPAGEVEAEGAAPKPRAPRTRRKKGEGEGETEGGSELPAFLLASNS